MKYKVGFVTLMVLGLLIGFSQAAMAALTLTETNIPVQVSPTYTANSVLLANTVAAGDSIVIGAYKVTSNGAANDAIVNFKINKNTGTATAAELGSVVSLYEDVNISGTYDAGVDIFIGYVATANFLAGTGSLTYAYPFTAAGDKYYIAVASVIKGTVTAGLPAFNTALDGKTIDCAFNVTNNALALVGQANSSNVQTIAVLATHLAFNPAVFNGRATTGATLFNGGAAEASILYAAVDDYGNVDKDFTDQTQLAITAYPSGGAPGAALTATNNAGNSYAGFAATTVMSAGKIAIDKGANHVVPAIETLTINTAGSYILTATSNAAKSLTGTTSILVSAGGAGTTWTSVTGVVVLRGIETYDTNHNGYLDRATIFFDAPINYNAATNIPQKAAGPIDCPTNAFTVTDGAYSYNVTGVFVNQDNGGTGIANAGPFGVTLTFDEKGGGLYDTGAKPQVTYNSAVGKLEDKNTPTVVQTIQATDAVEVDKAKPILMSIATIDANSNGKVEGIVMTFSEPVVGAVASANLELTDPSTGTATANLALKTLLQNGGASTISLPGGAITAVGNTVTIPVNETIGNTGILPIVMFMDNDAGAVNITDSATNAIGAAAKNVFKKDFTTNAADQSRELKVKDGASPIITNVITGGDGTGQMSTVTVTFSENMNTNNAYSTGGVAFLSTVPAFVSSGQTDYKSSVGVVSGNTVTYTITKAAAGTYDTEAVPVFQYDPTSGILLDANGFELAKYGTGGRTQEVATIDGAPPVIISVTTADSYGAALAAGGAPLLANGPNGRLDNATVIFSEQVKSVNYNPAASVGTATNLDAVVTELPLRHEDATAAGVAGALTSLAALAAPATQPIPVWTNSGTGDTSTQIKIYFNEVDHAKLVVSGANKARNGGDTGVLPEIAYSLGAAGDQIKDMNNVALVAFATTAAKTKDTTPPFVPEGINKGAAWGAATAAFANILTKDNKKNLFAGSAAAVSDSAVGDGYIDSFELKFSEDVRVYDAKNTAALASAFQVGAIGTQAYGGNATGNSAIALDMGVDADKNGVVAAADSTTTTNDVYVYGTSSAVRERWDTSATPTLAFAGGVCIYDLANGNTFSSTVSNKLQPFAAKASADGAAPVIVRSIGTVASANVTVLFSEPVYRQTAGAGALGAGLAGLANNNTVFRYDDFQPVAGNKSLTGTAIGAGVNANSVVVTVDSVLTVADVTNDKINILGNGALGVFDNAVFDNTVVGANLSLNQNLAINETTQGNKTGLMITIDDVIAPWITKAETVDADGNGYIDHIRLQFSESLKDVNADGYVSANALGTDVSSVWKLTGYTGTVKFSFFDGSAGGTVAAAKAASFAAAEPLFTDDVANDNVMYMRLDESGVPVSASGVGSTDWQPAITWVGQPNVSDFKPNKLNIATSGVDPTDVYGQVVDNVGPVLMSAETVATNKMNAKFSEGVLLSTFLATTDYSWTMSNQGASWENFVARATQPATGVIQVETGPTDGVWEATMAGTLIQTGSVSDNRAAITAGTNVYGANVAGLVSAAAASGVALYPTSAIANGFATVAASKTITVGFGTTPPPTNPGVTAVALNKVASALDISNKNVTRVYFNGVASASDEVAVKLVDVAGASVTATVTANAQGNFTGQIDASPLANGSVKIMAGKSVSGVVAAWYTGASVLKETLTIPAPAALAVTDVANDQGGFVDVTFTKSAFDGAASTSDFYEVDYYVLQGKKNDVWYTVATMPVDGNTDTTYRSMGVWVGMEVTVAADNFRVNAHAKINGAVKAAADAPDAMSSPYVYATGSALDNVVPGAFTQFAADGSAGAGVVVNWTAPADHGLYNAQWNLWGVDKYDVYRKVTTGSDYELVGSVTPGTLTYTDNVANGSTVYNYLVKAVDSDQITATTAVKAMASKGADFDGSGRVGLSDLVLLGGMWNVKSTDAAYVVNYDLNKNGSVGLDDLVLLGSVWNTVVAKLASTVPTVSNPFELNATVNEDNSMYFVNINVQNAANFNALAFTLNYDTNAFEFVKESVNGLVGISFANENQLGVIKVASAFQNDKFSGMITLGFKSKGLNTDMNLKMSDAEVAVNNAVSAVSGAPSVTLKALPTVYGLSQNFPNPFNPSTTITYSVPKTSRVELVVYNMAGQKVRTLVNTTQSASFYKVVWNGKNDFGQSVASGLYFYKLVAGDYSKVVKMNLIK